MSTDLSDEVKEDGGGGQAVATDNGCFIVDTHGQLRYLSGDEKIW